VLPIKPGLVDELHALVATHHRALGRAPTKADHVFLTPRGNPHRADTGNIRRLLRPILKSADIARVNEHGEHVDIHSLRHTAATRLARAGWPMAKLQRFMGHADPRTTQRYYDHLEVEDLEVEMDLLPDLRTETVVVERGGAAR
jgi:integrase